MYRDNYKPASGWSYCYDWDVLFLQLVLFLTIISPHFNLCISHFFIFIDLMSYRLFFRDILPFFLSLWARSSYPPFLLVLCSKCLQRTHYGLYVGFCGRIFRSFIRKDLWTSFVRSGASKAIHHICHKSAEIMLEWSPMIRLISKLGWTLIGLVIWGWEDLEPELYFPKGWLGSKLEWMSTSG